MQWQQLINLHNISHLYGFSFVDWYFCVHTCTVVADDCSCCIWRVTSIWRWTSGCRLCWRRMQCECLLTRQAMKAHGSTFSLSTNCARLGIPYVSYVYYNSFADGHNKTSAQSTHKYIAKLCWYKILRGWVFSVLYAIARTSVCLSVTRVYHRKRVEVRIMKFSPYGSPIPLVFAG